MSEVLDVSRNEDGEITQFLILGDDGQPDTRVASPENLLLYDPADELPFEGGLDTVLGGDNALCISYKPTIIVDQKDEHSYVLSVGGDVVETTPTQADKLLQGVYDAIANENITTLQKLHERIKSQQVRRRIINVLAQTFEESHRITIEPEGWVIDNFYLVDWNAKMYTTNDDPDEGDYVRSGNDTVQEDRSYEFVRFRNGIGDTGGQQVAIDGEEYTLTEREMLFLAKVKWLLYRRHFHPDKPFWEFAEKWATVEDEEPDLDVFDI